MAQVIQIWPIKCQITNVPEHCFTFSHRFRGSISHVPGGPIGPDGPGGPRGPGIVGQLRLLVQSLKWDKHGRNYD